MRVRFMRHDGDRGEDVTDGQGRFACDSPMGGGATQIYAHSTPHMIREAFERALTVRHS